MAVSPVQVEKFLKGVDYPAKKEDLLKHAQQQGADQQVLEALKQLPDQTYGDQSALARPLVRLTRDQKVLLRSHSSVGKGRSARSYEPDLPLLTTYVETISVPVSDETMTTSVAITLYPIKFGILLLRGNRGVYRDLTTALSGNFWT